MKKIKTFDAVNEHSAPNESHPKYKQWNNDCFVYSLFHSGSNQSSLRQVEYKGKLWDIINHFFFMSRDEMMSLSDNSGWHEMYQMAKTEEDRYVYKLLNEMNLSEDAKEVLESAKELVRKSFAFRKEFHCENPEYHLNAWDAGWAQLKPFLKKYYKNDYDEFVKKFKSFEKRMRNGVFEFGFLIEDDFYNGTIEVPNFPRTKKQKNYNEKSIEGEFYTPDYVSNFVDENAKIIFGENYRNEYMIYDPCAGLGSLTKDREYNNLTLSTLQDSDLPELNKQVAKVFGYDFLGEVEMPIKMDEKSIVIMNPPYVAQKSSNLKVKNEKINNKVKEEMKRDGLGQASNQTYIQFIYKVAKSTESDMIVIVPPLIFSSQRFSKFRKYLFDRYDVADAFIFQASHFSGLSGDWGISIVYLRRKKRLQIQREAIILKFKVLNNDFKVIAIKEMICPEKLASDWVREEIKEKKNFDAPQLSSSLNIRQDIHKGKMCSNSIGYLFNNCNNVGSNVINVSVLSSCYNRGCGISIIPENIHKIASLYTARKTIKPNWINWQDEYSTPNESHPEKLASDWVREEIKEKKNFDAPQLSSSLNIRQDIHKGKVTTNNIGYFFNKTNNIGSNGINVSLFTSSYADGHGLSIIPENIHKVVALFTARKTITPNWINCKDEYSAPNEEHPEKPASDWIRKEIKGLKTFDAPQMTSAIGVKQTGVGKSVEHSIGYLTSVANNVYKSLTDVFITSQCSSMGHGFSIIPENIHKVVALFTARKTITPNWINCKDEYSAPNEEHPEKPASDWAREEVKGKKTFDAPQMTSAINIKSSGKGSLCENSLGFFFNTSNNVYQSITAVSLFTSAFSHGQGLSIIPENIRKVVALFAARKTIKRNWINWQDEYSAPNEEHPEKPASDWIRKEIKGKGKSKEDSPNLSSSINVSKKEKNKLLVGSFGVMGNKCNNVRMNATGVFLMTSCSTLDADIPIIPENIHKVVALFAARKTITPNWINCKDEYSTPNESHPEKLASDWIREEIKGKKTFDAPQMTSAINIKSSGKGSLCENSLGFFFNTSNNVYQNINAVSLFTSAFSHGKGLSIIPENIHKVVALFTARKTIKRNWINWQDEYSSPRYLK
jgi:hypothetical protein